MEELENKQPTIKSFINTLFDSAIVVAVVTSVMYLISYLYLKGFYSYYGLIDLEIDFTLFRVLKTCIEIFISLLGWIIIYLIISIPLAKCINNDNENFVWTVLFFWMICLLFIRTAIYTKEIKLKTFYLALPIIMIIILIGFLIYSSKLSDEKTKKLNETIEKLYIFKSIPFKVLGYLCWISIFVNFVPKYGYQQAQIKSDYLIDVENQRILIYNDSEKSIFLQNNNNNCEYKYIIINNSDLSQISFEHYNNKIIFQDKSSLSTKSELLEKDVQEQLNEDNDTIDNETNPLID